MAESIFNLEIHAQSDDADKSLKELKDGLDKGKEAAKLVSEVFEGDVTSALKSAGEAAKTFGIALDAALPIADIVAFATAVAGAADKVSKWYADTFIYTEEQKALDDQLKSSNTLIAGYAKQVHDLDEEYKRMGKTASQVAAIDLQEAEESLAKAEEHTRNISNEKYRLKQDISDKDSWTAAKSQKELPGIENQLSVAQQDEKRWQEIVHNLRQKFLNEQNTELQAMAEAEISGRERAQEAAVGVEQAKWNRLRGLVKAGVDQNLAMQIGFENRLYAIKSAALKEHQAVYMQDPFHNAVQLSAINHQLEELTSQHEAQITRLKTEADRERAQRQTAVEEELRRQAQQTLKDAEAANNAQIKAGEASLRNIGIELDSEIEHQQSVGELKRHALDFDLEMGRISQKQHDEAIKKELAAERDATIEKLRLKQSLYSADSEQYARIEAQIQKIRDKYDADQQKADQQSAKNSNKNWQNTFKSMSATFQSALSGWIKGTESFSQAWTKLVNDMASKFVEGLEKQLMSFIQHKAMELAMHVSTEKAKDTASKAAHAKQDERTAYSAAKGAWESVVHTPIIGPILAPLAAASTFAAVTAFGSAEGGQYLVPSEQLTMLHRNEMVLPAGVADRMRGVIDSGGGGGYTVIVNHSVSAVDAESFQSHVRRHAHMIGNEVARVLRKRVVAG